MRCPSRTAVAFLALSGVACAVNRSGDGVDTAGASAGSSTTDNVETGGTEGTGGSSGGIVALGGSAGVFGVAPGNAGGDSDPSHQDHESGASENGGSGTIEPTDGGRAALDATEAAPTIEASSPPPPTCGASHAGGRTFTPSGAASAHCYWPHTGTSGWQSAVDACKQEGGHLATLSSAAESTFVITLLTNFGTDNRLWLGGTDNKSPTDESGGGPYVWITGEPFSYAPWAPLNPDGACADTCNGQRCCQHRVCVDSTGAFWDREEGELYDSVCESE